VFDLDGTLVDAMPSIGRTLYVMFNEVATTRLSEGEFYEHFASRFDAVFHDLCVNGRRREEVYAEWALRTATQEETPLPFNGIRAALGRIERAGAKLLLWTTRDTATTRALLARLGWSDAFSDYRCGDSGFPPKPRFDALRSMLGPNCRRERVILVGDGVSDIEAGKAFGCRTVGAAWCSRASATRLAAAGADAVTTSPAECARVLLSFLSPSAGGRARP
jgi:phosphoglycolate phosphatase-like HAD superfamily hydrolase